MKIEEVLQPILENDSILLRPLRASDFENLYAVASDPLIWEQHPSKNRYQLEIFQALFEDSLASNGALVIIDKSNNKIIGSSRYYEADFAKESVVIGYTFLSRDYWGGYFNRLVKDLMINHAFQYFSRILFHVDSHNIRSQKAMEKIGGKVTREFEKAVRRVLEYSISRGE